MIEDVPTVAVELACERRRAIDGERDSQRKMGIETEREEKMEFPTGWKQPPITCTSRKLNDKPWELQL
jgi:hypothetical protein